MTTNPTVPRRLETSGETSTVDSVCSGEEQGRPSRRLAKTSQARDDLDVVYAAARAITILAIEDGKSEVSLSKAIGVDRMTIRKWVGKPQ